MPAVLQQLILGLGFMGLLSFFRSYTMTKTTSPFRGLARTEKLREAVGIHRAGPDTIFVQQNTQDVPFLQLSDEEVITLIQHAFAPELKRLKAASPTIEATDKAPIGILGPDGNQTPSRLIYGTDYAEVNRSLVGVLALKWLMSGDYEAFTRYQNPATKLRQESFEKLRKLVQTYLRTSEELYALLVAIFANDLGKDEAMHGEIKKYLPADASKVNHDEVIYLAAINHDIELIEEFPETNPMHEAIILGLKLGAKLNVGQFAQAENVPGSLSTVTVMRGKPLAFDLKYFEIMFDLAGAQGHNDTRCVMTMSEPVFNTYFNTRRILAQIVKDNFSLRHSYDAMLQERADMLAQNGWRKLSVENQEERALLRLLTMGRVTEPATAALFDEAIRGLDASVRTHLVEGLSVDGTDDGCAVIPYYGPSLFANTLRSMKDTGSEPLVAALAAIFRLLSRVYHGTRPHPNLGRGKIVECYLDFARKVINGDAFPLEPTMLDELEIPDTSYTVPFAQWDVYDGDA